MNIEEVYKSKYFKINKLCLDIIGLWPYTRPMIARMKQIFMITILLGVTVPNIAGILKYCGNNRAICSENISALMFFLAILMKYLVNLLNRERMIKVYEFVSTNWKSIQDPDEQEIKKEFAKQGQVWTMAYSGYLLAGIILCTQVPLITPVLDIIIPLNDSRQKLLTLNAEFGFDPYKYYYELYFGYTILACICAVALVAADATFIVVALQCVSIFHIIGFLILIESAYNVCLLLLLGFTIAGFAIGFIAIVETINKPLIATRFVTFAIAIFFHLICITIPGQKVTNATEDLFRNLYDNQWYNMPKKRKTLLKIMMVRSRKPEVLTAGGLYQMNFENVERVIKTIASYAMVLLSIT